MDASWVVPLLFSVVVGLAFVTLLVLLPAMRTKVQEVGPELPPGVLDWATILTRAAEQLFEANGEKLDYVLDQMQRLYPALDQTVVRNIIEYAVHTLRQEKQMPATAMPLRE